MTSTHPVTDRSTSSWAKGSRPDRLEKDPLSWASTVHLSGCVTASGQGHDFYVIHALAGEGISHVQGASLR